MSDEIISKLLREYFDTDDPARRAELTQVLQDHGTFPRIFEVCQNALASDPEPDAGPSDGTVLSDGPKERKSAPTETSTEFRTTVIAD